MRKREVLAIAKREAKHREQERQFELICSKIANGHGLVTICRDKALPGRDAVRKWMRNDVSGEMEARYALAREDQADFHTDELLAIADNQDLDPNSRRVMVDTRKWIASKLRPATYGDRQQVDVNVGVTVVRQAFPAIEADVEDAETAD